MGLFEDVFPIIYGAISLGVDIGVGIACPPAAPFVGAAMAVSGGIITTAVSRLSDNGEYSGQEPYTFDLQEISEQLKNNEETLDNIMFRLDEGLDQISGNLVNIEEITMRNQALLVEIQNQIQQVDRDLDEGFNELKKLIKDQAFYRDLVVPVNDLWDALVFVQHKQTITALNAFMDMYEKQNIRKLLFTIPNYLKVDAVNPIETSMLMDVMNSKETLDNYRKVFAAMLIKLCAIEGFYYGKLKVQNNIQASYYNESMVLIGTAMSEYRKYQALLEISAEKYWPDKVKDVLKEALRNEDVDFKTKEGKEQVAQEVAEVLGRIHAPRDVFTILIATVPRINDDVSMEDYLEGHGFHENIKEVLSHSDKPMLRTGIPLVEEEELREEYRYFNSEEKIKMGDSFIINLQDAPGFVGVIHRSETYKEARQEDYERVRESFKMYAHMCEMAGHNLAQTVPDLFYKSFNNAFGSEFNITGFVFFDKQQTQPVVWRTNDAEPILADDETSILKYAFHELLWE